MPDTKYCSECRFCRPSLDHQGTGQFKFAKCARVQETSEGYELTHPDVHDELPYCRVERITEDKCGRDAKFFEART